MNIQRDSYASYIGHYPLLAYFGIAENESIGRERYSFMQVIFLSGHNFFLLFPFNSVSFFVLLYNRGVLSSTSDIESGLYLYPLVCFTVILIKDKC